MDRGKDAFRPGVSDVRRAVPLDLFHSNMVEGRGTKGRIEARALLQPRTVSYEKRKVTHSP